MTVTRDVVLDLLPLYLAGEASTDSAAIVEAFLARDTQLARIARLGVADVGAPPSVDDDLARASLERTRRLLQRRTLVFGAAVALTLLPISFGFAGQRIVWAMWRDAPAMAAACAVAAAGCWVWFLRLRTALRAPGF
ncbi:MAG: hypothetical protein R2708_20470 [Vicinamibacterales bacterium]